MRINSKQSGFTLVEMIVVAPLVIILIGVAIGYLSSLTGQGLQIRQRNNLAFTIQASLDEVESIVSRSTAFLSTTGTLTTPTGINDGTGAFTSSSGALIVKSIATTKNPKDPSRSIVNNIGTGACNTNNAPYTYLNIYFLNDNTLYRRTIMNSSSLPCTTPYQRTSCSPTEMAKPTPSSNCIAEDEKLISNVSAFTLTYYNGSTTLSTSDAARADNIMITLTSSQPSAGENISYTGTMRIKTINSFADIEQNASTPTVSGSIDGNSNDVNSDPDSFLCTWDPIGSASGYNVQYLIGGSTTVNGPQNTSANSSSVNINQYRKQTITCKVVAITPNGNYTYPDSPPFTIPQWTDCSLQNGWANFGGNHSTAAFTKTTSGLVLLKGLIKDGTTTNGTVVCQLPQGYLPETNLYIPFITNGTDLGRLQINTDGTIAIYNASNVWVNLSTVSFLPAGYSTTWQALTGVNSWTNFGSPYGNAEVAKDSLGRSFIQGVAKGGTTTSGTSAFSFPSNFAPASAQGDIYSSYANGGKTGTGISTSVQARGGSNAAWALHNLYYSSTYSASTFTNVGTMGNSWVNYGGSVWGVAKYTKAPDNVVSLRGLIKNGASNSSSIAVFTLPVGSRPLSTVMCDVATYASGATDVLARVDVNADGKVYVVAGASTTWVSLAGCDFLAEQ